MAQPEVNNPEKTGLAYWMDRVLEQHSKLNGNWSPETVHDLRVALRRCILIADLMGRETAFPAVGDAAGHTGLGGMGAEAWLSGRSLDRRAH